MYYFFYGEGQKSESRFYGGGGIDMPLPVFDFVWDITVYPAAVPKGGLVCNKAGAEAGAKVAFPLPDSFGSSHGRSFLGGKHAGRIRERVDGYLFVGITG